MRSSDFSFSFAFVVEKRPPSALSERDTRECLSRDTEAIVATELLMLRPAQEDRTQFTGGKAPDRRTGGLRMRYCIAWCRRMCALSRGEDDVEDMKLGVEELSERCSSQRKSLAYPLYEITLKKARSWLRCLGRDEGRI